MKYMLNNDTNIFIMKNKPAYLKRRLERIKPENLIISSISLAELFYGAFISENPEIDLKVIENFLIGVNSIEYDSNASIIFGKIKAALLFRNETMKDTDIQVASHAISTHSILITSEVEKFKKVKGLKLVNWIK